MLAVSAHVSRRPLGISFKSLRKGLCKFPLAAMGESATRFCGAEAPAGSPYCQDCRQIAHIRNTRR
ncbi:MAG: hypothetical protein EKK29_20375 [Hyphomicrobiales bacterium]|nr:MAG: hypothetical protein EKK29_20375 [Hyphomicrobiales bacterium]